MKPFALDDVGSLALLAKVVESQSFSAAARDVGLAKSAVSKRIALLEKRLGVRLLVRTTRRVTLSDAGLRVHEHCAALLAAVRGAAGAIEESAAGERGIVRVNAPDAFAQRFLVPLFHRYATEHPGVDFDLSVENAMIDLTSGRYDVVVRIARDLPSETLVARKLAVDRLVIVASPEYVARAGMPERPEDLARHSCMRYAPRTAGVEWRFKGEHGPMPVPVRSYFAAGDDVSLREAAIAGMGLTIMPFSFVAQEVAAGRLVTVLDDALWHPERTIHAILPEGRLAAPRVRRFVAFVADAFATPPWLRARSATRASARGRGRNRVRARDAQ